jgi:transposase
MSKSENPEVQPKPTRRRFTAAYKRRIVQEAAQCGHGEIGPLLRREGLYYSQLATWRKAEAEGELVDKPRGPQPNPAAAEVKRLQRANERLQRHLQQAKAIIESSDKGYFAQCLRSLKPTATFVFKQFVILH